MTILSIDVGIRNLAMCLLDESSNAVLEWDVDGIPPEHRMEFSRVCEITSTNVRG